MIEAAALLAICAFLAVELLLGFGVVHEHCLDRATSQALGRPEIESHWTLVLWPPLFFAANDPAGSCVRDSPLHEALTELRITRDPPLQRRLLARRAAQTGDD